MNVKELENRFVEISNAYSYAVQLHIAGCQCDADTKFALDEIARQTFYALAETQAAIINYLNKEA